jgi:NDP-sugar pyrophosphorylase family protein/lipopolysaccharide/colanic/teichoic acid biosynthesis glycosyltransferase
VQAVIIATGELNTLMPIGAALPSPLIPLVNRPVMEYVIESLARQKIQKILVCLYRHPALIEEYFGSGSRWGVALEYTLQSSPAGSAGSLLRIQTLLEDSFLVVPGDVLNDIDYQALIEHHHAFGEAATIAVGGCSPDSSQPVHISSTGEITGFEQSLQAHYCSGVFCLNKSLLAFIPPGEHSDMYHDLLPRLVEACVPVQAFQQNSYWNPIHNFRQFQAAQQAVLSSWLDEPGKHENPDRVNMSFLKAVEVQAGVWAGHNSAIHPTARLAPPVYIGHHCRIGSGVELGPNVVLGRAVYVSDDATIQDSTIFDHTFIGRLMNIKQRLVSKNLLIDSETGEAVVVTDPLLLGEVNTSLIVTGVQRAFDVLLSVLALAFLLPVLLSIALVLKIASGRAFQVSLCAARTKEQSDLLAHPSPQVFSRVQFNTLGKDGESASFGPWLERWELHRLPELLNVVRGEMRLVGTMPMTVGQAIKIYEDWHTIRPEHRPGFTGLWYVKGFDEQGLDHIVIADAFYLASQTTKQDLHLLWETPRAWLRRRRQAQKTLIGKEAGYG